MVICDLTLTSPLVSLGSETETQICAHEKAASLHRGGWTGAPRLPAGQFKLDGPLLVQVWSKQSHPQITLTTISAVTSRNIKDVIVLLDLQNTVACCLFLTNSNSAANPQKYFYFLNLKNRIKYHLCTCYQPYTQTTMLCTLQHFGFINDSYSRT